LLTEICRRIETSADPQQQLTVELAALWQAQSLQQQAELFESMIGRIGAASATVFHLMSDAYEMLGHPDAVLLTAACALRLEPEGHSASRMYRQIFDIAVRRGEFGQALAAFEKQASLVPEAPIAPVWQIRDICAKLGRALPPKVRW
jgi:hypothetical protein